MKPPVRGTGGTGTHGPQCSGRFPVHDPVHSRCSCGRVTSQGVLQYEVSISAGPPFSELSHQSCPFQEEYLRIFSVTFLQITCTCFPARFLVTIISEQLSCQLITGRNTKLPITVWACNSQPGKCFVVRKNQHQRVGVATTTQRPRNQAKPLLCHDHKAFL